MRPMTFVSSMLFVASLAATPMASAADSVAAAGPPDWAKSEMSQLIGTWITRNPNYGKPGEAYDAYGLEWKWGLGQKSVTGRLFVMHEGKEVGSIWTFSLFWHPGERTLIVQQIGSDGAYGVGNVTIADDGWSEATQTFHDPDGSRTRVLHRSRTQGDERVTSSFALADDGGRKPRTTYTWKRQR